MAVFLDKHGGYMIMTAVSEKDAVICIHDDYCIDIEAAEISQILLKIGELISNSYRSTKAEEISEP